MAAEASGPWKALEIKVPGQDLLEKCKEFLETLVTFLEVAKAILNVVKAFLVGIGNPIQALVLALIALVNNVIESLAQTGLYLWWDVPDFKDLTFKQYAGGYPAFLERWKGSLNDAQDLNRPRPVPGFSTAFFVLIVVDTNNVLDLKKAWDFFTNFFGMISSASYPPPANVKIQPVTKQGNPVGYLELWNKDKQASWLQVQWTLGTVERSADPSMTGVAAQFANEFASNEWLIERSTVLPADPVTDPSKPGILHVEVERETIDPRTNKKLKELIPVVDAFGETVVTMPEVFFLGKVPDDVMELNTYTFNRYYANDKKVDKEKTYYYRVRAFSGDLDYDADQKKINYDLTIGKNIKPNKNKGGDVYFLDYPTKGKPVVMGAASPILSGSIPPALGEFDLKENLQRLLLAAYSLGFYQTFPPEVFIKTGDDPNTKKPIYAPLFDSNGDPADGTSFFIIGVEELSKFSGWIGDFEIVLKTNFTPEEQAASDAGSYIDWGVYAPWTQDPFRRQAGVMTNQYASLALTSGGFAAGFKSLMEGALPFGPPDNPELTKGFSTIKDATNLSQLVFGLTQYKDVSVKTEKEFEETGLGISDSASMEKAPDTITVTEEKRTTTTDAVRTFALAYDDKNVRKNVLKAIKYIKTLGYQGVPPDWQRVAIFDLFPWSSDLLYNIAKVVQGLVDGFNDLMKEITQFIDMIIRKIEVLEDFIKFLIGIIDFIKSISIGLYFLGVWDIRGGVSDWFSAVDQAPGTKPPSTGKGGYTCGVSLAAVAPNVGGLVDGLKLIFGG